MYQDHPAASQDSPTWFGVNKAVHKPCRNPAGSYWWHANVLAIVLALSGGLFLLIDLVWGPSKWTAFCFKADSRFLSFLQVKLSYRFHRGNISSTVFIGNSSFISKQSPCFPVWFSLISNLRLKLLFPVRSVDIQEYVAVLFISARPIIWIFGCNVQQLLYILLHRLVFPPS